MVVARVRVAVVASRARQGRTVWHALAVQRYRRAHTIAIGLADIVYRIRIAIIARRTWHCRAIGHAVAVQHHGRTRTLAVGVQHVVDGGGITVVAGRADLSRGIRAIVLHVANAVPIGVRAWCAHTLAVGVVHVIHRAGVTVIAGASRDRCPPRDAEAIRAGCTGGGGLHPQGQVVVLARVRGLELDSPNHVALPVHEGNCRAAEGGARHGGGRQPDQCSGGLVDLINVVTVHRSQCGRPGEGCLAIAIAHLEIGRPGHHGHAQRRVTHQAEMDPAVGTPLPSTALGCVQTGVVHGHIGAIPDVVAHAHVMEEPMGNSGPYVGEAVSACQGSAQEVVGHIPVAEIAAEGHVEDAPEVDGRILVGGAHVVRTHPCASATGVAPQVALVVDAGVERVRVGIDIGGVRSSDQGRDIAVSRTGQRIGEVLEVVEDDSPAQRNELHGLVRMGFVQVALEQLFLTVREGIPWCPHVGKIDPPNL